MSRSSRIGVFAVLVYSFAAAAAQPVKLAGMPAAEFDKLPADTLVGVGNRTLTKAALLAEMRNAKAERVGGVEKARADALAFAESEKRRIISKNGALFSKVGRPQISRVPAPNFSIRPTITSIEPQVIEPGSLVVVKGVGFGEMPKDGWGNDIPDGQSQVRLIGNFPSAPYLTLSTQCRDSSGWNPAHCSWTGSQITAGVPWISPSQDQSASVVVVTKSGATSAPFSVQYRATRAQNCQVLKTSAVQGPSGPNDGCALTGGGGIGCKHGNPGSVNLNIGTDHVSLNLKNGWVFTAYGVWTHPSPNGVIHKQVAFTNGSPNFSATFDWISERGQTSWELELCAAGLAGVPFN